VQAGNSAASRLIQLVAGTAADRVMPPKGQRLTPEQIGILRAWIDQGLRWDDTLLPPETGLPAHWAFRSVTAVAVPRLSGNRWRRNPIDAFLAVRHQSRGVVPAPEAPRRTLIRRLCLDLLGLPPSPEEIDAFVSDPSPDAWERLVDRLLSNPHYGERWGRHWLDLARWAESEGYESNHPRLHAWRFRDYVVRAFNDDKPYDRFLKEQIAGDELEPCSDENLIATGFLAAARLSSNEEDKPRQRNDILVDVVNATAGAVLGLTLNCAQCHNHKFDPFTARDYYRFQGFFVQGQPANLAIRDPELWKAYEAARPPDYETTRKQLDAILEEARARLIADARKKLAPEMLAALETPADKRTPEMERLAREADLKFQFTPNRIEKNVRDEDRKRYDELKKKLEAMEKKMPERPQTFGFYSPATSPNRVDVLPMKGFYPLPYVPEELKQAKPYLLAGGDVHRRGAELDVGWPAVFGPTSPERVAQRPRSALAEWLTDRRNPLTARVWVNRLWQYHFGRGLVATSSDFGTRGTPPTHPELLDWLAGELMANHWSTKHLHRLILHSAAYRMDAQESAANSRIDPDNTLWWRWQPRRLEAEVIRDSLLAVSGELDRSAGGPGVPATEADSTRRSLYLFQKRDVPPPLQALFDGPSAVAESCPRRYVSTVPLQSLYLLNNEFAYNRARAFARRVAAQAGEDRGKQVEMAFRLALGRLPDSVERSAAEAFLGRPGEGEPRLAHFCQALMNLNEFLYLE
jgi:hypothetical protein